MRRKARKTLAIFATFAIALGLFNMNSVKVSAASGKELQPGEVNVETKVSPVPGSVNTWEVETTIEGKRPSNTNDVVVIIDSSRSMQESIGTGSKINETKKASKELVETLLNDSPNRRIALMEFNTSVAVLSDFTQDINELKAKIDAIVPTGETFTQGALNTAKKMLADSTASKKTVVLITDGEPTASFDFNNREEIIVTKETYNNKNYMVNGNNITADKYDYDKTVGLGGANRYHNLHFDNENNVQYAISHPDSAISEANMMKNTDVNGADDIEIHTLGIVSIGSVALDNILSNIASKNKYYKATSSSSLSDVFEKMANNLVSPADDIKFKLKLTNGFTNAQKINNDNVSDGVIKYLNKTIDWTIPSLTKSSTTDPEIVTATITFQIKTNDSIINAIPENGTFPIFDVKNSAITFIDSKSKPISIDMNLETINPKVNPTLVTIETRFEDSLGNVINVKDKEADVNIKDSSESSIDNFKMIGNQKRLLSTWAFDIEYTIGVNDIVDYEKSLIINGVEANTFKLNSNNIGDDIDIVVTYREEDLGQVTIKNITKDKDDNLVDNLDFEYKLIGPKSDSTNPTQTFNIKSNTSFTINDLPYGEYELVAVEKEGFNTVIEGTILLSNDSKESTVVVTHKASDSSNPVNPTDPSIPTDPTDPKDPSVPTLPGTGLVNITYFGLIVVALGLILVLSNKLKEQK